MVPAPRLAERASEGGSTGWEPPRYLASAKLIGGVPSQPVGRAEVAQSGTARVWKARGGIRLGSSKARDGRPVPAEILPLGAALRAGSGDRGGSLS